MKSNHEIHENHENGGSGLGILALFVFEVAAEFGLERAAGPGVVGAAGGEDAGPEPVRRSVRAVGLGEGLARGLAGRFIRTFLDSFLHISVG